MNWIYFDAGTSIGPPTWYLALNPGPGDLLLEDGSFLLLENAIATGIFIISQGLGFSSPELLITQGYQSS